MLHFRDKWEVLDKAGLFCPSSFRAGFILPLILQTDDKLDESCPFAWMDSGTALGSASFFIYHSSFTIYNNNNEMHFATVEVTTYNSSNVKSYQNQL
jgi:hypothetical protein